MGIFLQLSAAWFTIFLQSTNVSGSKNTTHKACFPLLAMTTLSWTFLCANETWLVNQQYDLEAPLTTDIRYILKQLCLSGNVCLTLV